MEIYMKANLTVSEYYTGIEVTPWKEDKYSTRKGMDDNSLISSFEIPEVRELFSRWDTIKACKTLEKNLSLS